MNTTTDPLARTTSAPKIDELQKEYERAGAGYGWWGDDATDVRLMRWPGQSKDGRKHRKIRGEDVFPWENAFDSRVPTVDFIVVFLTSVLLEAFSRAPLKCEPTEAGDIETAGKIQKVMEYYRRRMKLELLEEMELLLQAALTHGAALVEVNWERKLGTTKAAMSLQELLAIAASDGDPESPLSSLPVYLADPAAETAAAELVLALVPDLNTMAAAKRFVRAIRNEGVAEYRTVFVAKNRPCVRTLRFGRDVFIPPETTDLQRARVIFVRDFLTETEVLERVQTEGWDAEWAREAIATQGKMSSWSSMDREDDPNKSLTLKWGDLDTESHLIEVVHAYQQQLDDQDIPRVTCTVWCPHVTVTASSGEAGYASHYPSDLAHCELPFVGYQLERFSRRILASRGVPEIAHTWQAEEKTQCDMLADLSSITVNPPRRTSNTRGQKYEWGPGAQTVGRQGELEAFQTNTANAGLSFQIMEMLRRRRSEYFGIMDELVPAPLWQARLGHIVGTFLARAGEMFKQMAALVMDEQNVSTEELERITGVSLEGVDRSVESIVRGFDWSMTFDARDLDMEFTLKKLETVANLAVPLDREGTVSYSRLVAAIMTQIDSSYAGAFLADPKEAADRIKAEVDAEFVRMLAGNEAHYTQNDPAAQMKMIEAQRLVAENPKYEQAYQSDERFRAVVDNFMQNLEQSVKQQQNKQIGRDGVKPL